MLQAARIPHLQTAGRRPRRQPAAACAPPARLLLLPPAWPLLQVLLPWPSVELLARGGAAGLKGTEALGCVGARLSGGGRNCDGMQQCDLAMGTRDANRLGSPQHALMLHGRLGRPLCLGAPAERLRCEIGLRSVHTQQLRGRDQPCPAARVASRPSWITSSSASRACWAPRRRWAAQTSASAQIDGSDADLTPTLGFTGPACQRL